MRRQWIAAISVALAVLIGLVWPRPFHAEPDDGLSKPDRPRGPNLLVIVVDDQRADALNVTPNVVKEFPINFENSFTTTPDCCPSRSALLTGEYAHRTGITTDGYFPRWISREAQSLGPWLQRAGYYTGYVGKYFNGYSSRDHIPPGWDEFYGLTYDVGDRKSRVGLREHYVRGGEPHDDLIVYSTEDDPEFHPTTLIAAKALDFIDRASSMEARSRPFALFIATTAPNIDRTELRYRDAPVPDWEEPPSFLEPDMSDKPPDVRHSPLIENDPRWHEAIRSRQLRLLMGVNDLVRKVWRRIDANSERSRTAGVYFSDNGRMWGEHRLRRKYVPYEESIRVPLRMFLPKKPAEKIDGIVAGIDIAPTLMDLAGLPRIHRFDGRSLLPLIRRPTSRWRHVLLLEHFSKDAVYVGLRSHRWKYVRWESGSRELYDLREDPFELENLVESRPRLVARLDSRLTRLRG